MNFGETLKFIAEQRDENLKKLLSLTYDRLEKHRKYYYDWYKDAEDLGYLDSAQVNYLHYSLINKAIQLKKEKDEEKKL